MVDRRGVDAAERVRAAPYLRNFKLNCDVFKLRFLPEQPALLAPLLFSSAAVHVVPAALRREARVRHESVDRGTETERGNLRYYSELFSSLFLSAPFPTNRPVSGSGGCGSARNLGTRKLVFSTLK